MRWPCATWAPSPCPSSWRGQVRLSRRLFEVTYQLTRNLNKVIDRTTTRFRGAAQQHAAPSHRHRRAGPGGRLHPLDALSFDSVEAKVLNREVFETIYTQLHVGQQGPGRRKARRVRNLRRFAHQQGQFQFDLWGVKPRRPLGLGRAARGGDGAWRAQQPAAGAHAHGQHRPDPGQQRCFEPYTSNISHPARAQR